MDINKNMYSNEAINPNYYHSKLFYGQQRRWFILRSGYDSIIMKTRITKKIHYNSKLWGLFNEEIIEGFILTALKVSLFSWCKSSYIWAEGAVCWDGCFFVSSFLGEFFLCQSISALVKIVKVGNAVSVRTQLFIDMLANRIYFRLKNQSLCGEHLFFSIPLLVNIEEKEFILLLERQLFVELLSCLYELWEI